MFLVSLRFLAARLAIFGDTVTASWHETADLVSTGRDVCPTDAVGSCVCLRSLRLSMRNSGYNVCCFPNSCELLPFVFVSLLLVSVLPLVPCHLFVFQFLLIPECSCVLLK